jgi:hypothetical protein
MSVCLLFWGASVVPRAGDVQTNYFRSTTSPFKYSPSGNARVIG